MPTSVADRARSQLARFDQMHLILPDLVQAELIGRLVEVLGKIADDLQIRPRCILRVITTLEFLQHHFVQLGHRDLLPCDPNIILKIAMQLSSHTRSVRRASGFVVC